MKIKARAASCVVCWLAACGGLNFHTRGDVVTRSALKDATLIESVAGELANGAGEEFFVGRTGQGAGFDRRRTLIAFDLSGIPGGSTINSATLTLTMTRTRGGSLPVSTYQVTRDWGEGLSNAGGNGGGGAASLEDDATWLHAFYPSMFWTNPGGDHVGTASSTTNVGGTGTYTWSGAGLAADISSWVNSPLTNFGWILISSEAAGSNSKRFESRTSPSTSQRPSLTVNYTPPTGPTGACCVGLGVCSVMPATLCATNSGSYQGNSTACSPNPCPQPTGACCLPSGACITTSAISCTAQSGTYKGNNHACTSGLCPVSLAKFVDALPIMPVMQPVSGLPGGQATYIIPIRQVMQQLHRDLPPTKVWGYNGIYPGPTIEAGTGQSVTVTWWNDLRDSLGNLLTAHALPVDVCMHGPDMLGTGARVVTHLHGGHVPPAADGYPETALLPGEQTTYVYPNTQQGATLWYHDHALGITRLNVMMGLAGAYIIRDPAEASLTLPNGSYEIPLIIQDRSFNADGSFRYPASWEEHFFGEAILVNGKVWPFLNVSRGKYRFRLVNGCNSRVLTLALFDNSTFNQIASDGGLLPAPVARNSLTLGPGERADIVVDFAGYPPGTQIILTNSAPAPFPGPEGSGVVPQVMQFNVGSGTGFTAALPATLRPVTPIPASQSSANRTLILSKDGFPCDVNRWTINGLGWDDITEMPRLGMVEVWSFVNRSPNAHPMHMHLVQFQILDRQDFVVDDGVVTPSGPRVPPPAFEAGWKDTVLAMPAQITRVVTRFTGWKGLYPYHCHVLEHEDHEMMRQFRVICPADYDADGYVVVGDIFKYIAGWFAHDQLTDWDRNGLIQVPDIFAFLSSWFSPC